MSALRLLLWLQIVGWMRYLGRSVRSVKGALTAIVGLMVLVPWLVGMLFAPRSGGGLETDQLMRFGPGGVLLYCVLNLIFSPGERSLYFAPAEVQFLFAGPFSRRQVLAYKLALLLLATVPMSVLMVMFVRVRDGWFPAVFAGMLLLTVFLQLFTVLLGLIGSVLGAQFFSRGRWVTVAAVVLLLGLMIAQAGAVGGAWQPREILGEILDTPVWQFVTRPLQSFFAVTRAQSFAEALWPGVTALTLNVGIVVLVLAVDAHFLEASAAASARLYSRILRMRGKQVDVEAPPDASVKQVRLGLPMPPYLGGIGPVFWRQLTAGFRNLGRLFVLMLVVGVAASVPLLGEILPNADSEDRPILPLMAGMGGWLVIFLTTLVPFDFRGDIDRIGVLKTLPIRPWRLVLGQLLTPVLLLTLLQWLVVAAAIIAVPQHWAAALIVAAYVPAFTFVLIALENLLFLLFPVRVMASAPGDFQAVGRNVLLTMGKMCGLMAYGFAVGAVWVVVYLIWHSHYTAALAALPVLVVGGPALIPLIVLAFEWFDVGRDTPA